jgi:malyl-CoA/(S)-citramalyl-CoA lyase
MLNKKVRINRSELAVPGNRLEFFDKAAKSNADIIFLDLEDSVALNEKVKARKNVIEAINELDWRGKVLSVRVNGYDTGFIEDDISDIIKNTSSKLDLLMFRKFCQ